MVINPTSKDDSADYVGETDTILTKGMPDQNWSSNQTLGAVGDPAGTGIEREMLLRWDLPTVIISPTDTVCSTKLQLYVTDPAQSGYGVYSVNRHWIASEATWNRASASNPWEVPGAEGFNDRDNPGVGSIGNTNAQTTLSITLPNQLIQAWINDPTQNSGVLIGDHSNPDKLSVASHSWPTILQRPTLVLTVVAAN